MTISYELDNAVGPVRVVPVPGITGNTLILSAPCVLRGWSLRALGVGTGPANEGSIVAPGAGATVVAGVAVPSGNWRVNWQVELIGPAAAADQNNFKLTNGGTQTLISNNQPAAGLFIQPPFETSTVFGETISVVTVGAGTAGVTYAASFTIEPESGPFVIAELVDGNQPLGEVSLQGGVSDTVWFDGPGVHVGQGITINIIGGGLSGVLYCEFAR